jgi:DedD protein
MKYLFESEEEETETLGRKTRKGADSDQEITLGTRSILGIFFGLVLICGVFFGLGYSVGRGNSARLLAETTPADTAVVPDSHIAKPSATLSAVQPETAADGQQASNDAGSEADTSAAAAPETHPAAPEPAVLSSPAPAAHAAANPAPTTVASAPAAQPPAPALQRAAVVESTPTESSYMVQIAAVRVPEDANILMAALQKHGYTAVVRREPQDALLHIQLGPFVMRAEANAMRARLLSDGYNAVVK